MYMYCPSRTLQPWSFVIQCASLQRCISTQMRPHAEKDPVLADCSLYLYSSKPKMLNTRCLWECLINVDVNCARYSLGGSGYCREPFWFCASVCVVWWPPVVRVCVRVSVHRFFGFFFCLFVFFFVLSVSLYNWLYHMCSWKHPLHNNSMPLKHMLFLLLVTILCFITQKLFRTIF